MGFPWIHCNWSYRVFTWVDSLGCFYRPGLCRGLNIIYFLKLSFIFKAAEGQVNVPGVLANNLCLILSACHYERCWLNCLLWHSFWCRSLPCLILLIEAVVLKKKAVTSRRWWVGTQRFEVLVLLPWGLPEIDHILLDQIQSPEIYSRRSGRWGTSVFPHCIWFFFIWPTAACKGVFWCKSGDSGNLSNWAEYPWQLLSVLSRYF